MRDRSSAGLPGPGRGGRGRHGEQRAAAPRQRGTALSDRAGELQKRIETRQACVAIVGLGYVGLPLALAFCEAGYRVLGYDVDGSKVETLGSGASYIGHIPSREVAAALESGRFEATTETARLAEADAVLICVPTPLTDDREPDLSYVLATADQLCGVLRRGQLVVLESTTYPGTTRGPLRQHLEAGGLRCGEEFFLAYSPEREDPGNASHGTRTIPKVVGGLDQTAGDLAEALYQPVVETTVRVGDAETAEACKLTENIFRAVNIALVNELKVVYDALGVDVWEVLDAAETKPFGFMRFNPGPGWGGHCIPIDPFYLSWLARRHGAPARFIELAGEVNIEMPRRVVAKLLSALQSDRLEGRRILLLGLAYKRDVADPRESPAFEILAELLELGAEVSYHDPYIARAPSMRSWKELPGLTSQELTPALLAEQDAVILITDHSTVDYDLVRQHAHLIVDTRGVFPRDAPTVVRA